MKNIEIDEDLYQYIATNTQFIGESASAILRRLLSFETHTEVIETPPAIKVPVELVSPEPETVSPEPKKAVVETQVKETTVIVEVPEHDKDIRETVFNYINKEELAMQRGAVGRFLLILAALYRGHSQQFSVVNDISGRDRLYFAKSEKELAASGSSTKPRQIPESPFWVITNANTTRKKMMLTKVAIALGYNEIDAEKIRELL